MNSFAGVQLFPASYQSATSVTCDVELDGVRAPSAYPVYVTPRAKPIKGRTETRRYVQDLAKSGGTDLVVAAPAPKLEMCRFDSEMIRVRVAGNERRRTCRVS